MATATDTFQPIQMTIDPYTPTPSTAPPRRRSSDAPDAVGLLSLGHQRITRQFHDYERLRHGHAAQPEREYLVAQVCHDLLVHMDLEERLFYPAIARQLRDETPIHEAIVEHRAARALIARLRGMRGDDRLYSPSVALLAEYVTRHFEREQAELFPLARRRLDVEALGAQMHEMQQRLLAQFLDA